MRCLEQHDHATSEPLHKPASQIAPMHHTASITDENVSLVLADRVRPVQEPVGICSNNALSTDLSLSNISDNTCDMTNDLQMDRLSSNDQSIAGGIITASTILSPIGRADTENGLRFTQTGRTSSIQLSKACSANGKDRLTEAQGMAAMAPDWWPVLVMLLTMYAMFHVSFAICLAGVSSFGSVGFLLLGAAISFAMVLVCASAYDLAYHVLKGV